MMDATVSPHLVLTPSQLDREQSVYVRNTDAPEIFMDDCLKIEENGDFSP
jgi:hypothetical protein